MKDDPRIVELLLRYKKIKRMDLLRSLKDKAKPNIGNPKMSKGPSRSIKIRCPYHFEKTASFLMYKDGHSHCYGCHAHPDWIDLIIDFHKPQNADELLSIAQQFVRKINHPNEQKMFDF